MCLCVNYFLHSYMVVLAFSKYTDDHYMGNVVATNTNVCSTLVCIDVMNSLSSPNIVQPEEIMMHA